MFVCINPHPSEATAILSQMGGESAVAYPGLVVFTLLAAFVALVGRRRYGPWASKATSLSPEAASVADSTEKTRYLHMVAIGVLAFMYPVAFVSGARFTTDNGSNIMLLPNILQGLVWWVSILEILRLCKLPRIVSLSAIPWPYATGSGMYHRDDGRLDLSKILFGRFGVLLPSPTNDDLMKINSRAITACIALLTAAPFLGPTSNWIALLLLAPLVLLIAYPMLKFAFFVFELHFRMVPAGMSMIVSFVVLMASILLGIMTLLATTFGPCYGRAMGNTGAAVAMFTEHIALVVVIIMLALLRGHTVDGVLYDSLSIPGSGPVADGEAARDAAGGGGGGDGIEGSFE